MRRVSIFGATGSIGESTLNVIALNPTPLTSHRPPARAGIAKFMEALAEKGVNATFRETRGREIDAACGQLRIRGAATTEKEKK